MDGKKQSENLIGGRNNTVKSAFWYLAASLMSKGIAYLTTPFFIRMLTKSEFGIFNILTSWESILFIILSLDLHTSISTAKYDFSEKIDEFLSTIVLLSNATTICFWIIVEFSKDLWISLFSIDINNIRLLCLYFLFFPAFDFLMIKHRMYGKYKFVVAYSIVTAIVRTAMSFGLVYCMSNKLQGRIIGYLLPITFLNFFVWLYIILTGKKFCLDCAKYALMVSIPMIPHTLSGVLLSNSDRIMIKHYCSSDDVAMYSLAYSIGMLATLFFRAIEQAWIPWLFDKLNTDDYNSIRKKTNLYVLIILVLMTGIVLISPEIILIMGDKEYYGARFIMPPVIMGCMFQFIYSLYANIELYLKKTALISVGTILAAVINIVLNLYFIPRCGYIAAAYTTIAGYFALMIFHLIIVKFIIKKYRHLYNEKIIFVLLSFFVIITLVCLKIYDLLILRYLVILLICVISLVAFVLKRKELANIFKKNR